MRGYIISLNSVLNVLKNFFFILKVVNMKDFLMCVFSLNHCHTFKQDDCPWIWMWPPFSYSSDLSLANTMSRFDNGCMNDTIWNTHNVINKYLRYRVKLCAMEIEIYDRVYSVAVPSLRSYPSHQNSLVNEKLSLS